MRYVKTFAAGLSLAFVLGVRFILPDTPAKAADAPIPRVVSVTPAPGTQSVDALSPITISFNTAMGESSVEERFSIVPPVQGTLHWQDTTLVFTPGQPLIPATTYVVSLSESIFSQTGLPLAVSYFSTATMGVFVGLDGNVTVINPQNARQRSLGQGKNPSWAHDKHTLFFVREGALWQVNLDGQNERQLVQEPRLTISLPQESPRQPLVVYNATNAAEIDNLYSFDPVSNTVRQLTSFYEPAVISQIAWSPDGAYIAFRRGNQIWIMNHDGTNLRKLTTEELYCKVNFAWSPGGTQIAFTGEENVWVADIYALNLRKLSFDDRRTGWLDWSRHNRIVYEAAGLVVMDADGSNEQRIPTGGKSPTWIGNTELLSYILPLHDGDNAAQLWTMDPVSQHKEKIADIDMRWPGIVWARDTRLSGHE